MDRRREPLVGKVVVRGEPGDDVFDTARHRAEATGLPSKSVDVRLTDIEWELVHQLRLRGLVPAAGDPRYARLIAIEIVLEKGTMFALSAAGRAAHASWARFEAASASHAAVRLLHDGFEDLNRELLAVCSAWQVTPAGAPNDHRDVEYDWEIIGRLERLHDRAAPRIRRAARDASRFAQYDGLLRYALRMIVDEGQTEWFTSPRVDSYHTVWNRLHEDLLLALGLERTG